MTAVVRSAMALTLSGAVAVSAAFIAAPPSLLAERPSLPMLRIDGEAIALTAFNPIADQVNIITTYGQQAVDDTVAWVNDLVAPLTQGQFWPLSGYPGQYIANAVDSTANWAAGLASTAAGFIQAEIDYFGGLAPNLINYFANVVQNVINWVTGLIPSPFAAKASATLPAASARGAAADAPTPARAAATGAIEPAAPVTSDVAPSSTARQAPRHSASARGAASSTARTAAATAASIGNGSLRGARAAAARPDSRG